MKFAITPTILFDATGAPIDVSTEGGVRALETRDERLAQAVVAALLAAQALGADERRLVPQAVTLPTGPAPLISSIPVGLAVDQVVPVSLTGQPILANINVSNKGDGVDVAQGGLGDPMVLGDSPGSVSAKLRGIDYLLQQLQGEVRQTNAFLFLILNALNSQAQVTGALGQPLN